MEIIGIIGAMQEEIERLKQKMTLKESKQMAGLVYLIGNIGDKPIVLVQSGIGKVNAAICAQIMIDRFQVSKIIMLGVAGALSEELSVGDVVISTDAVQHDMDCSVFGDPIGMIPRLNKAYFPADEALIALAKDCAEEVSAGQFRVVQGRIASGDQFIASKEAKEHIVKHVGGICAEMEGAAVAHVCHLNEIPFLIVRAISDGAGEDAHMSFAEFTQLAAERGSALLEKMLQKI